jgi:hypothetical protein
MPEAERDYNLELLRRKRAKKKCEQCGALVDDCACGNWQPYEIRPGDEPCH